MKKSVSGNYDSVQMTTPKGNNPDLLPSVDSPPNCQEVDENDIKNAPIHIDDAIERLGMGLFQLEVLIAAGLCFAADAMEVLLLSFLSVILQVEWDLTERETDSVISVVFAGAMIGTLILGPLGDRIGRRPVFSVTAAIIAVFGLGTAIVPNFEWLLFVRFMVGFGVGGLTVPFDTLAEFIPTSHRGRNLLYIEFFWTGGTLLVPVLAYICFGEDSNNNNGAWKTFVVLCAIPCVVSTVMGLIYVPESPRWLLTQGRHDEAVEILRLAAKRNKKDPYLVFPNGIQIIQEEPTEEASVCDLFSPQWKKLTIMLWIVWAGFAFLYFGVIIAVSLIFSTHEAGVENGSYNFDYSAIFISASSEILGLVLVLLTVDRFGRVLSQTVTYFAGGVSVLFLCLLASGGASRDTLVAIAFFARMFMMGASCTTWVSTAELLPTEIRTTGHSAANAVARLGGFFSPYIVSEGTPLPVIGLFMFFVCLVTGGVSWNFPETKGKALGSTTFDDETDSDTVNGNVCVDDCENTTSIEIV